MNKISKILLTIVYLSLFIQTLNAQWEKTGELYGGFFDLSADSNKIVAYGQNGNSLYYDIYVASISIDTGKTWRPMSKPGNLLQPAMDYYVQGDKVFAMMQSGVYISKDNGQTWDLTNNSHRGTSMVVVKDGIFLIYRTITSVFNISKYNPSNNSWDDVNYFPENTLSIAFSTNKVYALTTTDFFVSNRNSINWIKYNAPFSPPYLEGKDIAKMTASDDAVVLIYNSGGAYTTANEGVSWQIPFNDFIMNHNAIYKNNTFYLKRSGSVMFSNDNTLTWQPITNGWNNTYNLRTNARQLAIIGSTLFASTQTAPQRNNSTGIMNMDIREQKWQYLQSSPLPYRDVLSLVRTGNRLLASTLDGALYSSSNDGLTWFPWGSRVDKTLTNSTNPKDMIAKDSFIFFWGTASPFDASGNSAFSLVSSSDYGETWRKDTNILFTNYSFQNDTLYAVDYTSKIHYSVPPYKTWKLIPNIIVTQNFVIQDHIIITRLNDSIVRRTLNGNLLPTSNFRNRYNGILTSHNKYLFMIIGNDSIAISSDNGLNWKLKKIQDAKILAYFVSFKDVIMVTDYYRNVFISKNNGETWIKFNSGIPDNSTRYSYGSGSAYFVDSHYVYLSFPGLGLFRRSINDFNGNILSGKVYNDKNNNGIQDANEIPISNIVVSSKASRNYTLSDSMGNYLLGAEITQNDTVRPFLNTPHATIKPAFYIIQTTDTGKNFGIYYTPNINDIRLTATHIQPARPGFLHKIVLTCENIGSTILNTKVNLDYDNLIEYQTSVPTPDAILSQSLTWNLLNFQPFEKRNITIQFKTPTTVNLNSILTYAAKIEPILGDIFPNDNIDTLRQFVVGSFDPNDKIANKSYIDYKQLDIPTPIVYTIRFQNTGNYPATFVRIIDTLSPFADISTLQILSYSHPMTYSLKGKGILDCLFNNINLPNSSNNELASHGFVKYSIKPLTTMQLGDVLRNSAQIYFDYNQPILTNTTENKAIILTLTEDIVNINLLKTIPNPTQGDIYFQMPESVNFLGSSFKLQVFNSLGETVLQKSMINATPNYINLSNLPDGLYLLKVQIGNTVFVAKTTLLKK